MPAVGAAPSVTGGGPHMVVDVEPRVWPGEHGVGGLRSEEAPPDEGGENGPAERLGEDGGIVEEERQELTVPPVGTVGDEEVEVRGTQELAQCVARDAAEETQEATVVEEA